MKSPASRSLASLVHPNPVANVGGMESSWRGGSDRLLVQAGVNSSESFTYHSFVGPKS